MAELASSTTPVAIKTPDAGKPRYSSGPAGGLASKRAAPTIELSKGSEIVIAVSAVGSEPLAKESCTSSEPVIAEPMRHSNGQFSAGHGAAGRNVVRDDDHERRCHAERCPRANGDQGRPALTAVADAPGHDQNRHDEADRQHQEYGDGRPRGRMLGGLSTQEHKGGDPRAHDGGSEPVPRARP